MNSIQQLLGLVKDLRGIELYEKDYGSGRCPKSLDENYWS